MQQGQVLTTDASASGAITTYSGSIDLFREYHEHLARGYARGVRAAQITREVDARNDPEVIAFAYTGIGNFVGDALGRLDGRRPGP